MKKMALILGLILTVSLGSLYAQDGDGKRMKKSDDNCKCEMRGMDDRGDGMGMMGGKNMKEKLTDAQKKAVQEIQQKYFAQVETLKANIKIAEMNVKVLMQNDNPDMTAVNKAIDDAGALKTQMAKLRAEIKVAIRKAINN